MTLVSINPSTGKEIQSYPELSEIEVKKILEVASDAQRNWGSVNLDFRLNCVNEMVGVLNDSSGGQSFENCHSLGPKNIADLSAKYKVEKFIHFSSIGADIESDSKYQQSKGLGEKNIQKSYPNTIIIRPSIVFGPGDGFFSVQAKLLKSLPIIILLVSLCFFAFPPDFCLFNILFFRLLRLKETDKDMPSLSTICIKAFKISSCNVTICLIAFNE